MSGRKIVCVGVAIARESWPAGRKPSTAVCTMRRGMAGTEGAWAVTPCPPVLCAWVGGFTVGTTADSTAGLLPCWRSVRGGSCPRSAGWALPSCGDGDRSCRRLRRV